MVLESLVFRMGSLSEANDEVLDGWSATLTNPVREEWLVTRAESAGESSWDLARDGSAGATSTSSVWPSPFSEIKAQAQLNLTRIVCLSGEHAKRLRALQARRRI